MPVSLSGMQKERKNQKRFQTEHTLSGSYEKAFGDEYL